MKAVILAGGRGGRLTVLGGPPKPLVELGGRALLLRVMDHLRGQGVDSFVVALGHRHEEVVRHPGWVDFPATTFSIELGEVETGARLRRAIDGARLPADEPFLLTYCDVIHDISVPALWAAHVLGAAVHATQGMRPPRVTMTTVQRELPWGIVTPASGRYAEKPSIQVNAGLYVVDPAVRTQLPNDPGLSWERHVLPQLDAQGLLDYHEHRGRWWSVNTLGDLRAAEAALPVSARDGG